MTLFKLRMGTDAGFESTGGEGQFGRITTQKPLCDGFLLKAKQWSQFRHTARNAVYGVYGIVGAMAILFFGGCPSAICGFIALGIVDSLNPEPPTRISHIREEVCKLPPPLAHSNAFGTIVFVADVFGIAASLDHALPHIENAGVALPMNESHVGFASTPSLFASKNLVRHNGSCSTVLFSSGRSASDRLAKSDFNTKV